MDAESGDGERVFAGQMYVEQLMPVDGGRHPWPIVFVQGGGQTGTVSWVCLFFVLGGLLEL